MAHKSLWFLNLLCMITAINAAHALIIDESSMMHPSLQQQIEEFNANSPITLSVITTPESYDVVQQAAENYNTYKLDVLIFYSKADDLAVLVQPEHEGIPLEYAQQLFFRYSEGYGTNFDSLVTEVMASIAQWQPFHKGQLPVCSLLKDGMCDKSCEGTDLDCLCGDAICEHFENSQTCPKDCKEKNADLWCGMRKDEYCDTNCLIADIDCPIKIHFGRQHRSATFFFLIGAALVLGVLFTTITLKKLRRKK